MKEEHRREIYASKCMKYLTFLDYSGLEMTSKNVEAQLVEKEKEIVYLKQREIHFSEEIAFMKLANEKQINTLRDEIKSEMKNQLSHVILLLKPEIVKQGLT